jgi:hypothetical protein
VKFIDAAIFPYFPIDEMAQEDFTLCNDQTVLSPENDYTDSSEW